jgi:hypothetical protein
MLFTIPIHTFETTKSLPTRKTNTTMAHCYLRAKGLADFESPTASRSEKI